MPVFYIGYLFKGVELHYTSLEKLNMGLTLINRWLRPYFLSHSIVVLTDILLKHILSRPEATKKLIKWVTEISEYDIDYQPCPIIKAQALTIFLVETMKEG